MQAMCGLLYFPLPDCPIKRQVPEGYILLKQDVSGFSATFTALWLECQIRNQTLKRANRGAVRQKRSKDNTPGTFASGVEFLSSQTRILLR